MKRALHKYLFTMNKEWYVMENPQILIEKIEESIKLLE